MEAAVVGQSKGGKGGRGLDSPDPRSLGGVFPLFPLPPPKGGYLETNIPSPSPPAPHPPPSNALPSRRHASLFPLSLSSSSSSLVISTDKCILTHPFFCVTLKKKEGKTGGATIFPATVRSHPLRRLPPLFRAINSVRHKLSSRLVNSLLLLPPPPTGSLLLHGEREETETWGGGKQ